MPITDAAAAKPTSTPTRPAGPAGLIDARFAKLLIIANGLVPMVVLLWDAYRHQLGVNEVNFATRTTGLIGLVLLTLTLLITPLRKLTGWNVLIAVRRNLGVLAFVYILLHFTIFFVFDRELSVGSTLHEIVTRQYLWFGTAALVLMIPLAITSTDGMVTRLGARRWKLLHRLVYLVAAGGAVHYILLVKADIRQPVVFIVILSALVAYRIAFHYVDLRRELTATRKKAAAKRVPDKKKKYWSGELTIARIFDETGDVKTFRMVLPGGGPLPFDHVAGQYLNLALMIGGKRINRSYTIASSPTRADAVEISVKRVPNGYASHHLHDAMHEGDVIKVSAPAGRFVFAGHEAERVVLIAGGVGITPMMSIVRSLTDRCWTGDIYLVFSVRTRTDVIFADELAYLQRRFPRLHVCISLSADTEPGWTGERGHVNAALLRRFVPDLAHGPILLCGPDPMMVAMRRLLVDELGVPDAEVMQEAFISPPAPSEAAAEPGAPIATAADPADATGADAPPSVRFERAGQSVEVDGGLTVLETAEDAGITIPFECRSGICGQCKTRLISGRVTMDVQDALTPADRAKGLILACQARAVRDIVVDA